MERQSLRSTSIGWMALIATIFAGATYSAFSKHLLTVLSPIPLILISEILTALFVLISFGTIPTVRKLLRYDRQRLPALLFVSILNSVIAPLLLLSGLRMTTAVNAELFSRGETVFLLVLAVLLLRERLPRTHLLATLSIVLGIVIVALRGVVQTPMLAWGDILILVATFGYALGGIAYRRYLAGPDTEVVLLARSVTAVLAFLLLAPFLAPALGAQVRAFPLAFVPALLGFAFLSRFLSTMSFYEAIERLPITTVSLFSSLSVVIGVLFAHWYLSEPIFGYHLVGGACILGGAILLQCVGIHSSAEETKLHLKAHPRHQI